MGVSQQLLTIGAVERDSGIARDTLRVWERRYGYPVPLRNGKGERMYSDEQLRHLQRIQRLISQGHRPGKLLRMSDDELVKLESELQTDTDQLLDENIQTLIRLIQSADALEIDRELCRLYEQQGMRAFLIKTIVPLLRTVGNLWAAGKLSIFEEHFVSTQIIRILNVEITRMQSECKKPLVLLATLPGEQHTMGLLMLSAMLSSHKVATLNLGGQVPIDQIAEATDRFNADAVGVTFSGAYHYPSIRSDLQSLREAVSEGVEIWTGGEGVSRMRRLPEGVMKFTSLEHLPV